MVQHNKKLDVEVLQNYMSFLGSPFFFCSSTHIHLSLIQYSMSLNIDMSMVLPLKSHVSVDPKNV